ncbi:MAG TPA: histidine kinase N-terminal domain-containing protein [Mycobacteriales bacterium]|nr:histidine kinase N-terminal domain-containing protein [Mycobacteriales bacterium]
MSTLVELLAEHTALPPEAVEHLQRLVGDWQLLSDLSFADLLLWVPVAEGEFLCVAQVRPTTGPTAYQDDPVGRRQSGVAAVPQRVAMREGRIFREADPEWNGQVPVRREAIPVRRETGGRVLAVVGRDTNLAATRSPSKLELAYLSTADDLCRMMAGGSFPAAGQAPELHTGPRAGDGLIRLDTSGRVVYASPNALSAYRRLGVTGDVLDAELAPLTRGLARDPFDGDEIAARIDRALAGETPLRMEVEARGAIVLFRTLPLCPDGQPAGALVLVGDVTEVRQRDRELLSKDATIREIHHRVKNNLQTVAALLRLQARRVEAPSARTALEESVRRVSSIAMVHETLAVSLDERVDFDGIVDRLLGMLSDVAGAGTRVQLRRSGAFGVLVADVATPLVMVLTEVVQNAVEHGFPGSLTGTVTVAARRSSRRVEVTVDDDGDGLPAGFSLDTSDRLGLQIVRTLVHSELRGTIDVRPRRSGRGTEVVADVPLTRRG